MSDYDVLPYQGDAYALIEGLTDVATGLFVNNATVTVTLFNKAGLPVTNAANLTAVYVPASNGNYRALIPRTAAVSLGQTYRCIAVLASGALQVPIEQDVKVLRLAA